MKGRNIFLLSNNKAIKAAVPTAPKKKSVMRDYPLNYNPRVYNANEVRRPKKKVEKEEPIMEEANQTDVRQSKVKGRPSSIKQPIQMEQIPQEEQAYQDENIDVEQGSSSTKETPRQKYLRMVLEYQMELDKRKELKEKRENLLHEIHVQYSNQMKLEQGIIPLSMQQTDSMEDAENADNEPDHDASTENH